MNALRNLAILQERLNRAAGRPVDILPVTKGRPPELINPIVASGRADIGENRVQEWLEKRPRIDPRARLHQIGRLQTNKVRQIIDHVACIQSLDRADLLREIQKQAAKAGRTVDVLLQVNPAREAQKGGALPEDVETLAEGILSSPNVRLRGLMLIAPAVEDPEQAAPLFGQTRRLYERLRPGCGEAFDTLSMGMSHDALVAAREGATMVRLGTVIFTDTLELEE